MIYVCVPVKNNAATVGLLLWKIRQVFGQTTREYQLLVTDDGSSDETPDVLQRYRRALPLTVVRPDVPGAAAACAALLEEAIRRSDRLKRDAAVIIPADFRISPEGIPDLLRRIESGADLAVAETPAEGLPIGWRLLRRATPWLLRSAVPGIRDVLSGCLAVRLVSARGALRDRGEKPFLWADGLAARAELVVRLGAAARQAAAVPLPCMQPALPPGPGPLSVALQLRRIGRELRPSTPPGDTADAAGTVPARSRAS
jgi:glycosyltransferase involved in cell wall biosynthesis